MFAVFAIYFTLPLIALSALPVTCDAAGECQTLLGVAVRGGRLRDRPDRRHRQADGPRRVPGRSAETYVGVLAVTILIAATNAGVLGVSRLTYSMGMHRQLPDRRAPAAPEASRPRTSGSSSSAPFAIVAILPGQADFLGSIYAFGAMLSFSMAHLAVIRLRFKEPEHRRPYRSPGHLRIARPRPAAVRGHRPDRAPACRSSSSRALDLAGRRRRASSGWRSASPSTCSTAAARGWTSTTTVVVATPQPVTEREAEYESILVAFELEHVRPRRGRHRRQARRAPPARHPRARDDHRPELRADRRRRCPSRSAPRRRSSSRPSSRAGGASRATTRRSAPARPGG